MIVHAVQKNNAAKIKRSRDINKLAKLIFDIAAGEVKDGQPLRDKIPAAVAPGKLGGLKGGGAQAAMSNPERRKEIY